MGSLDFLDPNFILEKTGNEIVSKIGYPAPEFTGLTNWINSEPIKSIEDLKGKVVLLEFWTLGCINCINTHEHTQKMHEKYKDQGFTVIGLHAPEFAYERLVKNVQKSVDEYGITYPVAQDNDFATWKAFNNRYWPAFYLIDATGNIRYTHFREGKYDEKERAIQELINERDNENVEQDFLSDNLSTNTAKLSIPRDEILSGGPAKDGIPAINKPKFITQEETLETSPYLGEDDL
ncbi:redoxin domain-containing protein [Candidatus Gracilibacteria bacterium]|nr:redoxin domain-containing protein [Candidatus Gracilibacteria bacterium]